MTIRLIYFFAKANWQKRLAHRLEAVMWIVRGFILPLILMSVWLVASASGNGVEWNRNQIITYYLLTTVVIRLTQSWNVYSLGESIRKGELSNFIIKPLIFWIPALANDLGTKLLRILTILPFIVVVFGVLGKYITLKLSMVGLLEFLVFILIGYVINFLIQMIVSLGAFWLNHFDGANTMRELLSDVFSGVLVPLALLPLGIAKVAEVLPFKYIVYTPINYLMGGTNLHIVQDLTLSLFWIMVLTCVCRLMYRQGIKEFSAIGI